MKIRLRLVYADGDVAATLLRPRRWSYAFIALRMEDTYSFFNYMRMEPLRVGPEIQKSDTNFRRALKQGLELARTPRA